MKIDAAVSEKIENVYIKKIIAQLPDLFFQFTVSDDFSIVFDYLGGSLYDFYELSAEEFQENPIKVLEDRVYKDDLMMFKSSIYKSFTSLNRWEIDYRVLLPVKGIRWIKVSACTEKRPGGKVLFYGIKSDITIQKLEEEEHAITEERNKFANTASGVGVWDWNLVTNEVNYSPESLKILELDGIKSLISTPQEWDERVHPDDREMYFDNINKHFEQKTPHYETFHRILCNGKYKWILDRGKVISRDNNGKPLRIVGTHTDISSQKEREQNLMDTLDLVNSQKNRLLNFAHIVSHNLRNHTGNLSSLVQLNNEGLFENHEFISYVKMVSDELSGSIDNLVDLVKIQNNEGLEKESHNLKEYLNKIFNVLVEDIHWKKARINNLVPTDFLVQFNAAYLESILLNLTTNAIKYSHPKRDLVITYSIEATQEYDVLHVTDNGLGIDLDKHKEQLFGLYKTFHYHKDSTGIGLYITKNQIEIMGGKIEVDSVINEGSTFKIFFKK
ncbi:PAS domain-containing protein [Flavobacterium sp.]|uniref:PAS domain-containing sensor histidine kinase n=1 Tax=Flavobacterium sp. TaxID=239 RepID=UPI0037513A7F